MGRLEKPAQRLAMGVTHRPTRLHYTVSERAISLQRNYSHDGTSTRDRVTPREGGYRRITPHSDGVWFLQPVFCCTQKRWWFTILDLRRLNLALRVSKFKMLTIKSILSQIHPRDLFVTIDLKDTYFHIQIVKRHRKLLRFALEGKPYQYCVLPFWLALAPRMFTKCIDAALAPLRLQGFPNFELP